MRPLLVAVLVLPVAGCLAEPVAGDDTLCGVTLTPVGYVQEPSLTPPQMRENASSLTLQLPTQGAVSMYCGDVQRLRDAIDVPPADPCGTLWFHYINKDGQDKGTYRLDLCPIG